MPRAIERDTVCAYIALGANLGDSAAAVRQAMDAIAELPGTQVMRRSPLYRSAPIASSGADYTNAVIEVLTRLPAPNLLQALQNLEQLAGRQRPHRNAPRTLDLDIVLYGEARMDSPSLCLPHPRMHQRAFVLRPLADIAPHLVDPALLAAVQGQQIEIMA